MRLPFMGKRPQAEPSQLYLLVGLGNPGKEYEATRHNAGFMLLDALAQGQPNGGWRSKFHGLMAEMVVEGQKLILLKPMTYMNKSGISVGEAAAFYKIPPERILVAHDELDLPAGRMKSKLGGSPAGHNGIKDCDRVLGQGYWRLRLGIGHPGSREQVHGHVLSAFKKDEAALLMAAIDAAITALPRWWQASERWVEDINGFSAH